MPPPPARHGATAPVSPTCTKPRVDARNILKPSASSSFARRGRLVTSARRAATRRRSRPCTRGMARWPARTRSLHTRTRRDGRTQSSFPARRRRRPRAQAAQEFSPVAVRQTCSAMATHQARIHGAALRRRGATQEREAKGKKRGRGCGAHDGAMVESWPARWRGVRWRGRCSCRWSPPRLQLPVHG
jgi:hypothetical protein